MKGKKKGQSTGLAELEGENIPRPVRKKRGGVRLKAVQHRRLKKSLAALSACVIAAGGAFGINALFFTDAAPNVVKEGFDTVLYELPTDGSTPDMHSALENIGYMNARFCAQDVWYSEMDGSVNTILSQRVSTWKQYSDGVLIQTDITTSSLINSAQQFCWVGDRVLWREAVKGAAYNGIDTQWQTSAPFGNMPIEDYKETRGLPGTSFSVYVINEETLLDASEVTVNGDGTYTQTYYLDPAIDKAPAYYVNQMMMKGGLSKLPAFEYITVTYTFDATWQVLSSHVDEAYTATKGLDARCTSEYDTYYEYDTPKAVSDAFDTYFKDYADKPATGAPEGGQLTAADCLAEAFAPVLSQPVNFALSLAVDGVPVSGLVSLDASGMPALSLRAQFGEVYVSYAGSDVFVALGGNKLRLDVSALAGLLGGGVELDTDALMAQLGGGAFEVAGDGSRATLDSTLSLLGLDIPVRFAFTVGEAGIALDGVTAELTVAGVDIAAELTYAQEEVPAKDMSDSADMTGLVLNAYDLFAGDALRADVAYTMDADGTPVALAGNVVLDFASMSVQGNVLLTVGKGDGAAQKQLSFAYTLPAQGGTHWVYLTLDGMKGKLNAAEALSQISALLGAGTDLSGAAQADLGGILQTLLSIDLASMLELRENSVLLAGGELLAALGVDFALGDISLSAADGGLAVSALGADVRLSSVPAFTPDVNGEEYADLTPVLATVVRIVQEGRASVGGTFTLYVGKTSVTVQVENGVLAWGKELQLSLDLALTLNGTRQTVSVWVDGARTRIVYGDVGVDLAYDELGGLAQTFEEVYARIAAELDACAKDAVPATAEELLSLVGAGGAVTDLMASLDLPALLSSVTFGGATQKAGSLAQIMFKNYVAELLADGDALTLLLGERKNGGVRQFGNVRVSASEQAPAPIPAEGLLSVSDLRELLDFAGATVGTLFSDDVSITFRGAAMSADGAQKVFDVRGSLVYHAGKKENGNPIVVVDTGNTVITVNPDMRLHVSLALDAIAADGTDLYFDFWMFDAWDDGELDIFVSISKYAEGGVPLRFGVPAGDILTLLAGGVSLTESTLASFLTGLGLPADTVDALFAVLDEYFLGDVLTDEEKGQFGAVGSVLMDTLGIRSALEDLLAGLAGAVGDASEDAVAPGAYLKALNVSRDEQTGDIVFTVQLDADLIYGGNGFAPLTLKFSKRGTPSLLQGIGLSGIVGNGNSETTDVAFTFGYEEHPFTETAEGAAYTLGGSSHSLVFADYAQYTFQGADELLKAVARTATHLENGSYVLNDKFHISGKATLSLGSLNAVEIGVDGLSFSFDRNNAVIINARLSYSKGLAFADSGYTELTIAGGKIFMRRTLNGTDVTYRAMSMEKFMATIMDQLVYIFNFSSLVKGIIESAMGGGTGSGSGTSSADDYGTILSDVLSKYEYHKKTDGTEWVLSFNGGKLTGDVLSDIKVTLSAVQGILRDLDVDTNIKGILGIVANLTLDNPCGEWGDKTDKTEDLSQKFSFTEEDWAAIDEKGYFSGSVVKVSFSVAGNVISEQSVLIADGKPYSAVTLPDLAAYSKRGYTVRWDREDFSSLTGSTSVYAVYTPEVYTLTLESDRAAEGFVFDEARGLWIMRLEYTYGTGLALPFVQNERESLVAFAADGVCLTAASDGADIFSDLTLRAQWELREYTVRYVADGKTVATQTAHYGDRLTPPEAPEKAGYDFLGWDADGTVTGDAVVTAQYAPATYSVTLVSEHFIDGFTKNAAGMYEMTFDYVYGSTYRLPSAVLQEGSFLDGFVYEGTLYTQMPAVTKDVTLTARWSTVGYRVVFVAEGKTVGEQNYYFGDRPTPPAVPEKTGYTGQWDIAEDFTVQGDVTIHAVYTANTYTVRLLSSEAAEGYVLQADGTYLREVSFVYDGAPVALDMSLKVPCFDFGGYYTAAGERVTEIGNDVALLGSLRLQWIDNTVTVTLVSDVQIEGSSFDQNKNAFVKEMSFNDNYAMTYAPQSEGYRLLAWFTQGAAGWTIVDDVAALDGQDVVAVWISEMTVTFTEVYKSKYLTFWYRYNVVGYLTGGDVFGRYSREISDALGLTAEMSGCYFIGKGDKRDELNFGDTFSLDYTAEGKAYFSQTDMNSWNYKYGEAEFGGISIKRVFRCGDRTVEVSVEASQALTTK